MHSKYPIWSRSRSNSSKTLLVDSHLDQNQVIFGVVSTHSRTCADLRVIRTCKHLHHNKCSCWSFCGILAAFAAVQPWFSKSCAAQRVSRLYLPFSHVFEHVKESKGCPSNSNLNWDVEAPKINGRPPKLLAGTVVLLEKNPNKAPGFFGCFQLQCCTSLTCSEYD